MGGETQTYHVQTIYDLTDKTSSKLGEIEKSARAAAASTSSLKQMVMGLGAVHLGAMAFGKAKTLLIDYNSSLEQSKTVIAGMLSLYTGASIDRTWDRASVSVERFQQMAAHSALTTKDLVETAQGLTRPLIQAGVKMSDIEKITFGVANASKAFGMSAPVVAMDIEQAVAGRVSVRDRFTKAMLAQKGIGLSGDQFNAKSQQERISILQKALTSPAITAMAEKQSQTMSGVMSTLEDNIQIALGKVGLPLFKAITEEIKGWNAWMEKNSGKIEEIGKSVGQGVMIAFKTIKEIGQAIYPILKELMGVIVSAMQFAAQHKDVLIGLAKAMLVYKIGQTAGSMGMGAINDMRGLGGGLGGGIKNIADAFGGLKSGTSGVASLFGTLASNLPGVIGGIAKLGIAAYTLGSFLLKDTEKEKQQKARAQAQILAAGEYENQRKELADLDARLGKYGVVGGKMNGQDLVNEDLKRWQSRAEEIRGNLSATEYKVIEEGIKSGMVTESTENGRRKLTLSHGDVEESTIKGHAAMMGQLSVIFKERALQAAQSGGNLMSSGIDMSLGQFYGMSKGIMGFYTEEISKKIESADDFDKATQANAPKQTINITIQQMSAKDPNRWLAEIDDIANRRNRAPTRPKRGWKGTPH